MKKLPFETSKGRFLVVDAIEKPNIHTGIKLSEITEEEASGIVDKVMNNQHFQNYNFKEITDRWCNTAIESLYSLLKSKGIHLFQNPVPEPELQGGYTPDGEFFGGYDDQWIADYEEAEQKTFYNPYIFKI